MCVQNHFIFKGCGHNTTKLWPCAKSFPCKDPYRTKTGEHVGECPQCLCNAFPLETFTLVEGTMKTCANEGKANQRYALSMMNFSVLLLFGKYLNFNTEAHANPLMKDDLLVNHVLKSYYRETACLSCGHSNRSGFGKPCVSCPNMQDLALGNPVRQYRVQTAKQVFKHNFQALLHDPFIAQVTANIAWMDGNPPTVPAGKLVHRTRPRPATGVFARRRQSFRQLAEILDEVAHRGCGIRRRHEDYTLCAGYLINIMLCLMAADPQVPNDHLEGVIENLSPILFHPDDHRSFPAEFDIQPFQRIILAYIESLPDAPTACQQLAATVEQEFFITQQKHCEAIAKTCPTPAAIMQARILHYSKVICPENMESDWTCCLCLMGASEGPSKIIQLTSCRHFYHLECLLTSVLQSPHNRNACSMCRCSWDALEKDEPQMYGIDWKKAATAEVQGHATEVEVTNDGKVEIKVNFVTQKWPLISRDCFEDA
jgi:hypothetical protein